MSLGLRTIVCSKVAFLSEWTFTFWHSEHFFLCSMNAIQNIDVDLFSFLIIFLKYFKRCDQMGYQTAYGYCKVFNHFQFEWRAGCFAFART